MKLTFTTSPGSTVEALAENAAETELEDKAPWQLHPLVELPVWPEPWASAGAARARSKSMRECAAERGGCASPSGTCWGIGPVRGGDERVSGRHPRILLMSAETPSVNIGEAFSVFSEEPSWMKKSLIVGLCVLIPIAGPFQLLGYQHRCYDHAKAGHKGMPDSSLGEDIGVGFFDWLKTLGNMFPMMIVILTVFFGCAFGPALLAGGAVGASGSESEEAGALVGIVALMGVVMGYGFLFVAVTFVSILGIDMNRRIYNGETFPMFSPGGTLGAIKRSPGAFVMAWLGMVLAGLVGALGIILCYFGALLTIPLSFAIRTRVMAQWNAVVQANMPAEVEGSY